MPGRVNFTPTVQDWIAVNRLWLANTRWRRSMRWFILLIGGIAAIDFCVQLAVAHGSFADAAQDALVPAAAATVLAFSYALTPLTIPRQVRTQFAQRRTMADPIEAEWNDERLIFTAAPGHTVVRWANLHRWVHDDASFAFLPTDRMILMVPKRAMTPSDIADLDRTAVAACGHG
jgi:hypothetical protein